MMYNKNNRNDTYRCDYFLKDIVLFVVQKMSRGK